MAVAISQKKIDGLLKDRPAGKREVADGGQPGLYLVIGPRTAKWIVRYRAPGTKQNVKLTIGNYGSVRPALGLHDARKAAQAALHAVSEQRDPRQANEAAKRRNHTIEDAFADFVERHSRARNKARTILDNEAIIQREIVPRWRGRRIQSITRQDIIELVDGIADGKRDPDGQVVAEGRPQSAVRVRALLSKAFSWFAAKSIIAENPFRDIEVPASPVARDRVLSDDEIRYFWSAASAVAWPFGDMARLLLLTGQRRAEVSGAMWAEFELDGDEPKWSIAGERTKNGRRQVVPLTPQVLNILTRLPRVKQEQSPLEEGSPQEQEECPWILSTNGATPVSGFSRAKQQIDQAMIEAARKATGNPDVKINNWTFHDLRRTAASGMAGLGVAVHVVEAVLNHKSGKISGVAAVYNRHDYAREKREALSAWANLVDRIVGVTSKKKVISLFGDRT
ncbi:tyrosine-type recombinase/integrase [Mesorhizobium sangaii]|uniref:Integrase n=1 Tax=Mesorhizobium sangaii TaxID=505389 RepID=A0A841PE93_9HYPH|nr:site-specific integrase [Mesorhizobium sangaii]MBB6413517.1 integrase [Mesorhizobium sangaii]